MAFDDRLLRVGIEIDGQVRLYDGLAITVVGSKFASITQNETTITIANLDKDTRDFLLTEGTPFNRLRTRRRNRIFIEAGRESYGYVRVFEGDITTANVSQPPDIVTTINALTSQFQKGNIVTSVLPSVSSISQIAQQAAESIDLPLIFEADDKSISNYRYEGAALGQLGKISEFGDLDVFVDDDAMVVKNKDVPRAGLRRFLSLDTGLVGIPQFTEFGIKVTFLFDAETTIGSQLQIESEVYPAANGLYSIYRLGFDLANRDTPFYYLAEARRIG